MPLQHTLNGHGGQELSILACKAFSSLTSRGRFAYARHSMKKDNKALSFALSIGVMAYSEKLSRRFGTKVISREGRGEIPLARIRSNCRLDAPLSVECDSMRDCTRRL